MNPDILLGPGWDTEADLCLTEYSDCGAVSPITNHGPQYELVPQLVPPNVSLADVVPLTHRIQQSVAGKRFVFTKDERMTPHHCVIFPRAVWAKINGYNERIRFAGNDYDFNARIVQAGMNLAICTYAMSFHKGGVSTREAVGRGAFDVRANCPKFSNPPSNTDFSAI
jgi:GT2 family glycosyltransferase